MKIKNVLKNLNLQDKNIIITPEGLGKSTDTIEHLITLKDDNYYIYGCHTIENAIEKSEMALHIQYLNKNQSPRQVLRISSNSELFRNMIERQSKPISKLFQNSDKLNSSYIHHCLYSYDGKFHRLNNSSSYNRKMEC